eukprot:4673764-Amphidinium_carterae.1
MSSEPILAAIGLRGCMRPYLCASNCMPRSYFGVGLKVYHVVAVTAGFAKDNANMSFLSSPTQCFERFSRANNAVEKHKSSKYFRTCLDSHSGNRASDNWTAT